MKNLVVLSILWVLVTLFSCSNNQANKKLPDSSAPSNYDLLQGEGKFKDVKLEEKLNIQSAEAGSKTFAVKCFSCHKLTNEKLVGPGLLGITKNYQPSWIMNFITNTDVMLEKDPQAQAMLVLCLVTMPNQNLSDEEARNLLEFMRKNDGVKP